METKIEYAFQRFLQEIGIKITSTNTSYLLKTNFYESVTLLDLFESGIVEMNAEELLEATGFDEIHHALFYLYEEGRLIEIDKELDRFVFLSIDFTEGLNKPKIRKDLEFIVNLNQDNFDELNTQILKYFTVMHGYEAKSIMQEDSDPAILDITVYFDEIDTEYGLQFYFNDETEAFEKLVIL